ncbi:hypothetical protein SCHPADRAFT_948200 [Schizopora paradoxa]|uniref:Uncharacterized protein n=1 Tax=Schizopora paradoxa TaxID=27342 RepID=A0A0H2RG79_9AGAM|nr:hypothetical protein SCHPADRAFT_948200 [Schizopora paradoxa]
MVASIRNVPSTSSGAFSAQDHRGLRSAGELRVWLLVDVESWCRQRQRISANRSQGRSRALHTYRQRPLTLGGSNDDVCSKTSLHCGVEGFRYILSSSAFDRSIDDGDEESKSTPAARVRPALSIRTVNAGYASIDDVYNKYHTTYRSFDLDSPRRELAIYTVKSLLASVLLRRRWLANSIASFRSIPSSTDGGDFGEWGRASRIAATA